MQDDTPNYAMRRALVLIMAVALLVTVVAIAVLNQRRDQLVITGPAPTAANPTPADTPSEDSLADATGVRRGNAADIDGPEDADDRDGPLIEAPEVLGLPRVAPERVAIPSLDVESFLIDLGLNDDGTLEVPADFSVAGWYADGPHPGATNSPPALIVGHVDSKAGPAIFFRLKQIEIGATIEVTREDGTIGIFEVVTAEQHPKDSLPTDEIYARRTPSELVLVTCTGEFNSEAGSYLDNFVVTARLDREASLAASEAATETA